MNKLLFLALIPLCWACTHSSNTEKYQNKRANIVNVREKIRAITIDEEDVLIGENPRLYLIDSFLIIKDYRAWDKMIHLFDKNNFSYLTGVTNKGQGPGEIANVGHIGIDGRNRKFYVSDHGKNVIFSYALDSVLNDPEYRPTVKMKMDKDLFPSDYEYINDTLSFGIIIEPIGVSDFKQSVGKWNMETGKVTPMKYTHPDITKKRITFAASIENGIYVECYTRRDLMTICSLDGELKCNIYGPNWDNQATRIDHYSKVIFCGDKIWASYAGREYKPDAYSPTRFFVFNTSGDYLRTVETGYMLSDFCYDQENNRLLLSVNDAEIQFACLDLEGLD
jgi:hypothetical protein